MHISCHVRIGYRPAPDGLSRQGLHAQVVHCLPPPSPLKALDTVNPQLRRSTRHPNEAQMIAGNLLLVYHGPWMSAAYAEAGNCVGQPGSEEMRHASVWLDRL